MKQIIWIVVIVLVIWGLSNVMGKKDTLLTQGVNQQTSESGGVIKFGVILPLTGDGAAYGEPMMNVTKIAVDEINAGGGIDGKKIELIVENGMCNGTGGANAAQKLVNVDDVEVILGGFCSSETLAAVPVAEAKKTVVVSGGSSSPDLTGKSLYFSRTYPSDASQGAVLAQVAYDKGMRKVAFLQEQLDYPLGIYKAFEKKFTCLGGVVTKEEFPSATSDFRSMIAKAKAQKPDGLFVDPQTPAAGERIAQQLQDAGWKIPILVSDVIITTPETIAKYKAYEGAIGAIFGVNETSTKYQSLKATYTAKYGEDLAYPGYSQTVYDAVYLVRDAIDSVGYDGTKIANWLHQVNNWEGASGLISIDSTGDRAGGHQAQVVKNGKMEPYK